MEKEEINEHDDYEVAVTKNEHIVGHVPHSVSRKHDEVEAVPNTLMTQLSLNTQPLFLNKGWNPQPLNETGFYYSKASIRTNTVSLHSDL